MEEIFDRQKLLIGEEKLQSLHQKTVAIFGLGGVGSYVVEGLARSGIGNFVIVDGDKVDVTNINRQIIATTKTVGRLKVDVAEERIKEINNFDFTIEDNKVHVSFTVYTVYGYTTISKGVEY